MAAPPDAGRCACRVGQDDAPGPVRRARRPSRWAGTAPRPGTPTRPRSSATSRPRCGRVLPDLPGGWTTHRGRREGARRAARARARPSSSTTCHALEGTAAEGALGRLVDYAPRVAGGHRRQPRARRRSTSLGSGCPASCWSSGRTTCGSAPGRSSSCSATSTTTRCCRATSRSSRAGPRAGRPASSCSTSRRAAGPPTSAGACCSGAEIERPAAARVPRPERAVRAAGGPARVPRRHLRAGPAVGAAVRSRCAGRRAAARCSTSWHAGSVFTVAASRTPRTPFRYHEVLRQHLDRMLVEAIGEAEARAQAREGRVGARGGRRAARGASRLLPGGGLGRRPAPPRRAGRAARGDRAERLDRRRAAGDRAPRPVGRAGRRPPGAQRRPLVGGASTATCGPRRRSVRRGPRTPRAASGSASPRGSIPVAMPTPDAIGALRTGPRPRAGA